VLMLLSLASAGCRSGGLSKPASEAPSAAQTVACAPGSDQARASAPGSDVLVELFPGVRADIATHVVEFDAKASPMLMDDPRAPLFFVETLVCAPDTREHESLMVTDIKASHLHAAMLAAGFTPGSPGLFKFAGGRFEAVDAMGDRLDLVVLVPQKDQTVRESDPRTWIVSIAGAPDPQVSARDSGQPAHFGANTQDAAHGWVFAGSRMRSVTDQAGIKTEGYDADGTGVIVGLCCFGSETIAWSRTFSPDASIDEPEWVADFTKTPPPGTVVRVRVKRAPGK